MSSTRHTFVSRLKSIWRRQNNFHGIALDSLLVAAHWKFKALWSAVKGETAVIWQLSLDGGRNYGGLSLYSIRRHFTWRPLYSVHFGFFFGPLLRLRSFACHVLPAGDKQQTKSKTTYALAVQRLTDLPKSASNQFVTRRPILYLNRKQKRIRTRLCVTLYLFICFFFCVCVWLSQHFKKRNSLTHVRFVDDHPFDCLSSFSSSAQFTFFVVDSFFFVVSFESDEQINLISPVPLSFWPVFTLSPLSRCLVSNSFRCATFAFTLALAFQIRALCLRHPLHCAFFSFKLTGLAKLLFNFIIH